ncbi:uroporphyrinogen-III synthase [Stetteria hydrogenophila]
MAEEAPCTALLLGPDPPPPRLGPCRAAWVPVLRADPVPGCSLNLLRAGPVDFIAFTSPRAPRALEADARARGVLGELRRLAARAVVGAVGPRTARAVREALGVEPVTPARYTGRDLALLAASREAGRVAWVRGSVYNRDFKSVVEASGAALVEVEAYRITADEEAAEKAAREAGRHDFLALTSPLIASLVLPRLRDPPKRAVLVIGPTTLRKALEYGVEAFNYCVPEEYSLEGLAACIEGYLGGGGPRDPDAPARRGGAHLQG